MGCIITSNIYPCKDLNAGGVHTIFVTNKRDIYDYYFSTADTKFSNITSLSVNSGITWYEYVSNPFISIFSEKEEISSNGNQFIKTFTVGFEILDPIKRSTLKEIIDSRNFTMVWKSSNNNWFILGEDYPCRVSAYDATTNTIANYDSYNVVITSIGKYQTRSISSDYVAANILPFGVNYSTATTVYSPFSCTYFVSHPLGDPVNILRTLNSVRFCPLHP